MIGAEWGFVKGVVYYNRQHTERITEVESDGRH
jgi:hypothetical protein